MHPGILRPRGRCSCAIKGAQTGLQYYLAPQAGDPFGVIVLLLPVPPVHDTVFRRRHRIRVKCIGGAAGTGGPAAAPQIFRGPSARPAHPVKDDDGKHQFGGNAMSAIDLKTYDHLGPAADLTLGSLNFGRALLKGTIKDLTPEQLAAKPANFKNDIATLVVHIAATEVLFSHLIMGREIPESLAADYLLDQQGETLPRAEGETVESLISKLDAAFEYVHEMLKGLSEDDMPRIIEAGPGRKFSVRWMIGLLPMHQLLHRGHIQMLRNRL